MDIMNSIEIASSGLTAQSERLKIIAQNIANADSGPSGPGQLPYQRKTISFQNVLDREMGLEKVQVNKVGVDSAEFQKKYDPNNPAADKSGFVQMPNVNTLIEVTDMKEAKNAYQANLSVIEIAKSMIQRTLELLRS